MTYQEAKRMLAGRQSRKLEGNTYLERRDDFTIAVRFHATDVVTFRPTCTELDSGGWHTKTTAERMSSWGPCRVFGSRGGWRVVPADQGFDSGGWVYFDGMRISPDGRRLRREQPNAPRGLADPVVTVSGWTGY